VQVKPAAAICSPQRSRRAPWHTAAFHCGWWRQLPMWSPRSTGPSQATFMTRCCPKKRPPRASNYAHKALGEFGIQVTVIDRHERPRFWMRTHQRFVRSFEARGGRFLGQQRVMNCGRDGLSTVVTTLATGATIRSEKLLCAMGRAANVEGLHIAAAGLLHSLWAPGSRRVLPHCRAAHLCCWRHHWPSSLGLLCHGSRGVGPCATPWVWMWGILPELIPMGFTPFQRMPASG